jgi:hypothetical protein
MLADPWVYVSTLLGKTFTRVSRAWNPMGRLVGAYSRAYDTATATGDYSIQTLQRELQAASIPGSYGDGTHPRVAPALAAWEQGVAPKRFRKFVLHFKG